MIELIESYPYFKDLYDDLYNFCLNIERMMEMFSKELHEMDKNTIRYMIEEQQETIDDLKHQLAELKKRS